MSDLDKQFDRVSAKIHARATSMLIALTTEADGRLREKTPVDTGHARGNWNVAIGGPDDTTSPASLEMDGPALPRQLPAIQAGDEVWLTNAVPYIEALEYGHSKQAPAGMVRVTAAELVPLVEQIVTRLEADRGL